MIPQTNERVRIKPASTDTSDKVATMVAKAIVAQFPIAHVLGEAWLLDRKVGVHRPINGAQLDYMVECVIDEGNKFDSGAWRAKKVREALRFASIRKEGSGLDAEVIEMNCRPKAVLANNLAWTIDEESGKWKASAPADTDVYRMALPWAPDELMEHDYKSSLYWKTVCGAFDGQNETRDYFAAWMVNAFMHDALELQNSVFLIGQGGTGKTTLMENWLQIPKQYSLLGEVGSIQAVTKDDSREMPKFIHNEFVICGDASKKVGEIDTLKRIIERGTVSVRMLYKEASEAKVNASFVVCSNRYGLASHFTDSGINRRIVPINLNRAPKERIAGLGSMLATEDEQKAMFAHGVQMLAELVAEHGCNIPIPKVVGEFMEASKDSDLCLTWMADRGLTTTGTAEDEVIMESRSVLRSITSFVRKESQDDEGEGYIQAYSLPRDPNTLITMLQERGATLTKKNGRSALKFYHTK